MFYKLMNLYYIIAYFLLYEALIEHLLYIFFLNIYKKELQQIVLAQLGFEKTYDLYLLI